MRHYRAAVVACALAVGATLGAQSTAQAPVRLRAPQAQTMFGMPALADLNAIDAEVVFLGVPSEVGRNPLNGAGSSLGPAAIREASLIGGPGRQGDGIYDRETGETMLKGVRIVDAGDVPANAASAAKMLDGVTHAVTTIVARRALPVVLGGDHSITFAVLRGYRDAGQKIHVIHFDAHQDFGPKAERSSGEVFVGQGNHLTHAAELPWIAGMSMIGLRGLSRGSGETASQVRARNIEMISASQAVQLGAEKTVARIPAADAYYVTIDIDVLDPAVAPATGTPVPGGFTYYQLSDLLAAIAAKGKVVGFDIMEVSPPHDEHNRTSQVAVYTAARFLGAIFKHRK